jgi:hypothetical protein
LVGTVGAVEVVSARGISKDLVVASYTNTPGILTTSRYSCTA